MEGKKARIPRSDVAPSTRSYLQIILQLTCVLCPSTPQADETSSQSPGIWCRSGLRPLQLLLPGEMQGLRVGVETN